MKKRILSVLIILSVALSAIAPVCYASSGNDHLIPLDDLTEGAKRALSALELEAKVELDTNVYPAVLHIYHINDYGEKVEFSRIELNNSVYDEGLVKSISGYDNLELFFPYPDNVSTDLSSSVYAYFWMSDCTAILTGMERGSQTASDAELTEAGEYVYKALDTDVKEGFTSELFEAGDIKYAVVVSRTDDNMRILKLQAGNTNVSFGIYKTRDDIRKAMEGLSWGDDDNTGVPTPTVAPNTAQNTYSAELTGRNDGSYAGASVFVLDKTLYDCTQLDISIKMAEYTGNPFRTWIVYGCDRSGNWKKLDTFVLDKKHEFEYQTFTLEFNATDITALSTNIDGGVGSKSFYVQYSNAVAK